MLNEQKLRNYIRKIIIEILKEDDPYGQPDEDKYLFKTDQDYLAGIKGEAVNEEGEAPSAEELAAKQKAAKEAQRKQAYQRFFSQALAKFGYSSPASIPDEKKKEFFDYIDANWTSKQEQPQTESKLNEAAQLIAKTDDDKGNPIYIKSLTPNLVMTDKKEYAMKFDNKSQFSQILKRYGYSDRFYKLINEDQGWGYRLRQSDDYEVDVSKCGHEAGKNIVDKLKYKPGIIDVSYSECIFHAEPGTDISKYLTPDEMKFIKRIDELAIKETSATGGVAGYETPRAFTGQKGISKKQKSIANQLGYELVDKSYAVKDQGDTQDLKESHEQMDTKEMLEKLQFSENDAVANVAKRILNAPDFNKQVKEELKWSGGFLTAVLKGNYDLALQKTDGYNYKALTGKNKFQTSENINENDMSGNFNIRKMLLDILERYNVESTDSLPIKSGILTEDFGAVINEIMVVLRKVKPFGESITESIDSLYLKDENLTPEQKLGLAMRHVRNNLYEVEKVIQKTIKMKNEQNIDSTKVGKRTYQSLKRINEKVIRLMVALNDLK